MWGLGIGGVMLVVALTGPQDKKTDSRGGREVKHVLTDFDTRKVGVDSLAANIKLLYAEHNSLSRELGGIRHQLELLRRNPGLIGANGDFSSGAGDLAEEVRNMREELKLIKRNSLRRREGIPKVQNPVNRYPVRSQRNRFMKSGILLPEYTAAPPHLMILNVLRKTVLEENGNSAGKTMSCREHLLRKGI